MSSELRVLTEPRRRRANADRTVALILGLAALGAATLLAGLAVVLIAIARWLA